MIFIVDTSGSMKNNWATVNKVVSEILDAYPQVKGMQIMNDNGNYLIDGYSGRWISIFQNIHQSDNYHCHS